MASQDYGNNEEQGRYLSRSQNFFERNLKRIVGGSILGLVALVTSCQSVYTVPADSEAVVKRFGAYVRKTEPGVHLKIPYFIESAEKVPIKKVQREEFGFRTVKSGVDSEFLTEENASGEEGRTLLEESLMLTGDLNMANVEFLVQYKIKDPVAYLFNLREPIETIRDSSLSVMKQIIGDGSVDEAITIGRIENEAKAKQYLQRILDDYRSGIDVVTVKLQSCNPPSRVRPSFNEVNRALQEKERRINEAMEEYNKVIPKAKGEAEQMIKTAEGVAIERVNQAKGDVQMFEQMRKEYANAPEITRRRLYFETMEKVLPGLEKIIVEQRGAEGGILLNLNLNQDRGKTQ